jgi:hypothetical protein
MGVTCTGKACCWISWYIPFNHKCTRKQQERYRQRVHENVRNYKRKN